MKLSIENRDVPQYIRHQPKSNCRYCKLTPRVNRRITRQSTIIVEPNSGKFEMDIEQFTDCEYHTVANWLTNNQNISDIHT